MAYLSYKFIHILSIVVIFLTLGGLAALSAKSYSRKLVVMINGLALVIAFVAGFGLLHKLNIVWPWPTWIWLKMIGWLIIGMAPAFAKKLSPLMILSIYSVVAAIMIYVVLYKPL